MSRDDVRGAADELAGRLRAEVEPRLERARDEAVVLAERAAPYVARARDEVTPLLERAATGATGLVVAAGPLLEQAVETVSGVLEEAGERGGAAWVALQGGAVHPPVGVRRWRWAVGAAVAGAAAGAAVAYVASRLRTQDAPGALDPEQVEAVVDRPAGTPTV